MRDELSIDDELILYGVRIIVPGLARKDVLEQLHTAHQGIERTKRRARQTVYWPGINNDITNTVASCDQCQKHLPSQQQEQMISEPIPSRVFEDVSADYFSCSGSDFLVYVDRLSGWPVIYAFNRGNTTANSLIRACRRCFVDLGVPVRFRCDGGPQFSSMEFRMFLNGWGVELSQSSPHYPQSNGHAESAVKLMKKLIQTSTENGNIDSEQFQKALLEWRNTPRERG